MLHSPSMASTVPGFENETCLPLCRKRSGEACIGKNMAGLMFVILLVKVILDAIKIC